MMVLDRAPGGGLAGDGQDRAVLSGLALAGLAIVLTLVGGRLTPSEDVDGYGLISALPTIYWVGLGIGLLASGLLLRSALRGRRTVATAIPVIWLVALHLAPQLAHAHLRFPTVWVHIGFVRLIEEQQTGDVLIDARFAWPGFFGAFVGPLGQIDDRALEIILRLWPAAIIGATAVLVSVLANRSYPTVPLIGPLSAVVYIVLSWTGQDYFSPQSFGYTAYLTMLVLLESGPLRTAPAWSATVPVLTRFAAAGGDRPGTRSTPIFVTLVLLSLAAIVSHPLAPFFICTGLVILGLYGRTLAWRLLVLVGMLYVIWFFITAEPWYSTQLEFLISQIGSLLRNADQTTTARVVNASAERILVTQVRSAIGLATFFAVLVIGVAMALDRFRHLRPAIPLAPLAGIPSVALALQSYGGEIIFRVLLFTLPMAAILIARVLTTIRPRVLTVVVPALILALTPVLLLARFGNESFEMTTAIDRATAEAAYAHAGDDGVLYALDNSFGPLRDRQIGRSFFTEVPVEARDEEFEEAEGRQDYLNRLREVADERGYDRIVVVFTPSMQNWRIHGNSAEPDSLERAAQWLAAQPGAEVVYRNGGGWVIEI